MRATRTKVDNDRRRRIPNRAEGKKKMELLMAQLLPSPTALAARPLTTQCTISSPSSAAHKPSYCHASEALKQTQCGLVPKTGIDGLASDCSGITASVAGSSLVEKPCVEICGIDISGSSSRIGAVRSSHRVRGHKQPTQSLAVWPITTGHFTC